MLVHQVDDIMLLGRVEQKADSSLDICVPECREYFPQQCRSISIFISLWHPVVWGISRYLL